VNKVKNIIFIIFSFSFSTSGVCSITSDIERVFSNVILDVKEVEIEDTLNSNKILSLTCFKLASKTILTSEEFGPAGEIHLIRMDKILLNKYKNENFEMDWFRRHCFVRHNNCSYEALPISRDMLYFYYTFSNDMKKELRFNSNPFWLFSMKDKNYVGNMSACL
jgi:hypothetical protein